MRRVVAISAIVAVLLAGVLVSVLAFQPSPTQAAGLHAAKPGTAAAVECCRCPKTRPLPLPADAVDRARIQAPFVYRGFGPAVVELAWLAKFKLNVWASTPFQCSNLVRSRTVVVDLLFPKMLPSASLSEGVVLVSLFPTGYRVWEVGH